MAERVEKVLLCVGLIYMEARFQASNSSPVTNLTLLGARNTVKGNNILTENSRTDSRWKNSLDVEMGQ